MAEKKWISGAIKKPGALHEQLGVPPGAAGADPQRAE